MRTSLDVTGGTDRYKKVRGTLTYDGLISNCSFDPSCPTDLGERVQATVFGELAHAIGQG